MCPARAIKKGILLFTKEAVTESGDMLWAPNTLSLPSKQETMQFQPHPSIRVLRLCNAVVSQTFSTPIFSLKTDDHG